MPLKLIIVACLLLFPVSVGAQSFDTGPVSLPATSPTTSTRSTTSVTSVSTSQITGYATRINGRELTLRLENDQIRIVTVPDNVQIRLNGRSTNFEDIELNDRLTATVTDDGEVVSIEGVDEAVNDLSRLLPLILIGLLLLLILIYWIINRSQRGYIKTTPTKLNS